ncbi:acyl-CoA dehydrogenase family protein [Paenibacillus qinlingensis]|uniref:Alkylation response protein AidB-like acyl-CoA dehydrogenase n=1 Tax=Paenibacillus qinlingensis TaxID=1837343 RepID=A0ABU1NYY7_9BACL|nr:acyl-CoA dehydrogenase family protein [Paenibacillus qinlingensis]MDR6552685.1 alkylation response protein AidB-like acyl-CoA dehydrogenase [Paenibacillus qinlingensis]
MHFSYTSAQQDMRKKVREFALTRVEPTSAERDELERFDRGIFDSLGELGWTGIPWPQAFGGGGADFLTYAMVIEELSRVCASTSVMLSVHTSLASWAIHTYGTDAQKQTFLLPMAGGHKLGAYCLTESESGSDAGAMRTTATKDGDFYVIDGSKLFVTNGGEAEVYIVFAVTNAMNKPRSCTAFIVEKGMEGLIFGTKEKKLGIRSSTTMELRFEGCRVPAENRLGPDGEGFRIAMRSLDGGRIGIAAQATGIGQGALDAVVAYGAGAGSLSGELFDAHISEMATHIEAARLLTYQAAWRKSQGLSYGKQAAIAKLFASDTAVKVCLRAVQLCGAWGCLKESKVERYLRDAKVTQIYEGTNEIQRIVISRLLLSESM